MERACVLKSAECAALHTHRHGDMWTQEEDDVIDHAVRMRGLRWRAVAELLPGRTESGCRNR